MRVKLVSDHALATSLENCPGETGVVTGVYFRLGGKGLFEYEVKLNRRARVTDATRFPGLFMAEGFVTRVHIGDEPRYEVAFDGGRVATFFEGDLHFL